MVSILKIKMSYTEFTRLTRISNMGRLFLSKSFIYYFFIMTVIFFTSPTSVLGTLQVISQITDRVILSFEDTPALGMPETMADYGIDGYVAYSDPPDACKEVRPPPRDPPGVDWILLAKHTPLSPTCGFLNKTDNAMNAGYSGIIIHNVGSNSTTDMDEDLDPSETYIYACFIGEYYGHLIRDNFSYPADQYFKTFVRIRHEESSGNNWLVFLVSFLVIICLCALLVVPILMLWNSALSCLDKIKQIRRRRRRTAIINKFPITDWAEGDACQSCVICLDDFEPHDKVRILPCSHGFHSDCIDPWLQRCKKFCPICKRKVIVLDGTGEQNSDTDDETTPLIRPGSSSNERPLSINSPSASGNTFAEQSENPFQRALRLARTRRDAARQNRALPSTSTPQEVNQVVAVQANETEPEGSLVSKLNHNSETSSGTSCRPCTSSTSSQASTPSMSQNSNAETNGVGDLNEVNAAVIPEVTVIDTSSNNNLDPNTNINANCNQHRWPSF